MKASPQLLVEWEPPWRAFVTSVAPALSRSRGFYHLQIRSGVSARAPFCSIVGHFITLALLGWLLPHFNSSDVKASFTAGGVDTTSAIYWNPGFPELQDVQGANSGRAGQSGGDEFFHPTQIMRVSRGPKLSSTVVDAPTLDIPISQQAVANLLAISLAAASAVPVRTPREWLREPTPPPEIPVDRIPTRARYLPTSPLTLPIQIAQQIESANRAAKLLLPSPTLPAVSPSDIPTKGRSQTSLDIMPLPPQNAEPPANAGSIGGTDSSTEVVLSVNPEDQIGLPANSTKGSFTLSPQGHAEGGLGARGKGTGISSGSGPGTSNGVEGPGSASEGSGRGARPNATGGISSQSGPGGTGFQPTTAMRVPGVTIHGGVVNVPSFGSGAGPRSGTPSTPLGPRKALPVVVIATSRSGGAMSVYGELKGGRVYTIYIDLPQGSAVLQFADPTGRPGFEQDLTPPEPLQTYVPSNLVFSHSVISCVIDRTGALHNLQVLEAANQGLVPHIIEALKNWRFRPALRGDQAIDVNAILGFAINTQ